MAAHGATSISGHEELFSNFQFEPPKPVGKYRPFARRNRFRAFAAMRNQSYKGSVSGSSQNLLDSSQMMSMQEDAKSRKLSSEVMKNRLYESVLVSPHRKRSQRAAMHASVMNGDVYSDEVTEMYMHPTRMAMSMPVTPATSTRTTPCTSPTMKRRNFLFNIFSRSQTMDFGDDMSDIYDDNDDTVRGIATIFSPQPKCIPAKKWAPHSDGDGENVTAAAANSDSSPTQEDVQAKIVLQDVPRSKLKQRRSRSPGDMDL